MPNFEKRLKALEEGSDPPIDDFADFVRWCAEDCPPNWRWDSVFAKQMEELAEKAKIGGEENGADE
ncbi:MAG: hypothetical protein ABR985_14720 [Methanotrichaceae archaeon]|jgi:hypothetical protein